MNQLCLCRVKANKAACDACGCVEDFDELRWVGKFIFSATPAGLAQQPIERRLLMTSQCQN